MAVAPSAIIQALAPFLPQPLVCPSAHSVLLRLGAHLPACAESVGFECSLTAGSDAVDLGLSVKPEAGAAALSGELLQRSEVWQRLQRFAHSWAETGSPLRQRVPFLFLEFDSDGAATKIPEPAVFFALDWPVHELTMEARARQRLEDYEANVGLRLVKDVLRSMRGPLAVEVERLLERCFFDLPDPGVILHFAAMLSRPGQGVRLSVQVPRHSAVGYLAGLGWQGVAELELLFDRYAAHTDFEMPASWIQLDFDVGSMIGERLGVTLQPAKGNQWRPLLESLVDSGLCESGKRDALLAWPGLSAGRLEGHDRRCLLIHYIEHLKMSCQIDRPPQVKAYFGVTPRFPRVKPVERTTSSTRIVGTGTARLKPRATKAPSPLARALTHDRSRSDYDVLIVGGGPAGLSTWLHLHALAPELAKKTLLVEKARYPRDKLCGGGITPLGSMLLEGLGLTLGVPALPIHNVEFRFGERKLRLQRPNAFQVIRRYAFDHALAKAAVGRGLDLHEGETFETFERVGDALVVATSTGEYRVRILIGADGAYSAVRKSMELGDDSRIARLIEIVTPVDPQRDPEYASNTAVFDFTPVSVGLQGYVWHFPCIEGDAAAMNHGIYDSRVNQDRQRADLKAIFARELELRQISDDATAWAGHPVRCFSESATFSQPNILLIGDAAGVDPALGEGIAPSLDYGDFAANTLITAFRDNDFSLADAKARLLEHAVGRSLAERAQLADALYAGGADGLRRVAQLLAGWLG